MPITSSINLLTSDASAVDIPDWWKVGFSSLTDGIHINSLSYSISCGDESSYGEYHSGVFRNSATSCVANAESLYEVSRVAEFM